MAFNSVMAKDSSPEDYIGYWIDEYGKLTDPAYSLKIKRVRSIFKKMRKIILMSHLSILNHAKSPSLCIRSGHIIITKKAIDICYNTPDMLSGDSRMAFVIGHEMAHLKNGDFWYANNDLPPPKKHPQKKGQSLPQLSLQEPLEIRQKKELRADRFGIVYMSFCDFNPSVIVDSNGSNFFQDWLDISGRLLHNENDSHPSPYKRAQDLLAEIKTVINHLDYFNIGLRLYQLGRYDDALEFFEFFSSEYPCKAVINNIGLIHYQKAMKKLMECDPQKAKRFKLSTAIDFETTAMLFSNNDRNRYREGCADDLFDDAIDYFENAYLHDKSYLHALINYSSALIMSGKYEKARGIIKDDILIHDKQNPAAINNLAVALYLLGKDEDTAFEADMFKQASQKLIRVIQQDPDFSLAYYNLERLQNIRKRNAAANESWDNYLSILQKKNTPATKNIPFHEPSPYTFGSIDNSTISQFKGLNKREIKLSSVDCEYFTKGETKVIAFDGIVEIVEKPLEKSLNIERLISQYGRPGHIYDNLNDKKVYLYPRFALDIEGEQIKKVIYFKTPEKKD
jgi:tetratricopeptide (TPR) repeat protein